MINPLFGKTIRLLEMALDLRAEQHRAILSNIANQQTPGYRALDISFEDSLKRAAAPTSKGPLAQTHPAHLPPLAAKEAAGIGSKPVAKGSHQKLDGNTVNAEKEMAKLAENTLMYNATVQLISRKLAGLKHTIREGR